MAGIPSEQMSEEQLRQIISSYLDEVSRCYEEEQRSWMQGGGCQNDHLEQKASELLEAMMISGEPGERRRAILQVLCRAKEHREPSLPS